MNEKDETRFNALLAEKSGRYDEMMQFVLKLVESEGFSTSEVRNFFAEAAKHQVAQLRVAIRNLERMRRDVELKERLAAAEVISEYQQKLIDDLTSRASKILSVLEDAAEQAISAEEKCFVAKLQADFYRYMAESDRTPNSKNAAEDAYEQASKYAEKLKEQEPLRLAVSLNYAIFCYEILNMKSKALQIAKDAHSDAKKADGPSDMDATVISKMLHDNIALWENRPLVH